MSVRTYLIATTAAFAASTPLALMTSETSQAQSITAERLLQQLEGKKIEAVPEVPTKGRIFRARSFTAKESDPVTTQPAAHPVKHPEADVEIFFTPASARIAKQAEPDLRIIGQVLSDERFNGARFRIAGHTDGIGGHDYNLALSRRRAEAVRRFLIEKYRIPAQRIEAIGFGKQNLKDQADIASSKNRRVQIVNLSATK